MTSGVGVASMPVRVLKLTSTATTTAATPGVEALTVIEAVPFWPGINRPLDVALATVGAEEVNVRPEVTACWLPSLNEPVMESCREVCVRFRRTVDGATEI